MRSILLMLPLALILSGCFLTASMEDITTETKDAVKDSNNLIRETKDGQALGAALELMTNPHNSVNIRAAAAETVFTKGPEDRIGKYIGLPTHIKLRSIQKSYNGKAVEIPNVAIIDPSEKPAVDGELGVAPISAELYAIQAYAALSVLEQLAYKSKVPGLTGDEMDYLRATTARMILVSTAVLGGVRLDKAKEALKNNSGRPHELPAPRRQRAAELIMELSRTLSLNEGDINDARANIEARLGIAIN